MRPAFERCTAVRASKKDKPFRVVNSRGEHTIAWRDASDLKKYMHRMCRKEVNPRMWTIAAQPNDPMSAAAALFDKSDDPECPSPVRDKSVFSFDNGV
eukprot:jgi/Tetstr1/457986/TSEL_044497.t1